jgi:hypothetical protein
LGFRWQGSSGSLSYLWINKQTRTGAKWVIASAHYSKRVRHPSTVFQMVTWQPQALGGYRQPPLNAKSREALDSIHQYIFEAHGYNQT